MVTVQNISSLIASADTTQAQRAGASERTSAPGLAPAEIQQIRQISSEANAAKAKFDKEREPSTPKKTDAGFGAQEDKSDYQFQETKRSKKKESGRNLDLVA